jgi:DdrB-like protein
MQTTIHFTTPLGAQVSVHLETNENYLHALRKYGAQGFTSGDVVKSGGLRLPLENAERFDWRLIGARPAELRNNMTQAIEPGVWYKGDFYKRRELEPVETKKMKLAAAIKYSRGARDSDPQEIREKSGEFEYVTLILFRGAGHLPDYDIPLETTRRISDSRQSAHAAD